MKLSQYKEKKNSKKIIIIILIAIVLLIGGIILDKTFANFKVQKSFKVMEGNFIYEGSGDVIFSFYNNGKNVSTIPKKEEGVSFLSSKCSNNASVKWHDSLWAPIVTNLNEQGTKCELYFGNSAVEYLINLQKERPSELAYDGKESLNNYGTDDNNLRFIGSNPNNYVDFNNDYIYRGYFSSSDDSYIDYNSYEECTSASSYNYNCEKRPAWRIIGVMNNITDENGSIGSHLKLIRNRIGNYSWDSTNTTSGNNSGNGINEWSTSVIETVLNENYYKKEAGGKCYNNKELKQTDCPNWESIGLTDEARKMISKVKWNTGAINGDGRPYVMYSAERGFIDGQCIGNYHYNYEVRLDSKSRTTEWMGYVGLIYPSDYFFSIGGELRTSCMQASFDNSDNLSEGAYNCTETWIVTGWDNLYTITPVCHINESTHFVDGRSMVATASRINYTNGPQLIINFRTASSPYSINPTVYLNSNIQIEEDTSEDYGSVTNPFRLIV